MRKAFTLVEILIVLGVISVIAALVLLTTSPLEAISRARDSNRMSQIIQLAKGVETFNFFTASSTVGIIEGPDWINQLRLSGEIRTIPIPVPYLNSQLACPSSLSQANLCYDASGPDNNKPPFIIYAALESVSSNKDCPEDTQAWAVYFSTEKSLKTICLPSSQYPDNTITSDPEPPGSEEPTPTPTPPSEPPPPPPPPPPDTGMIPLIDMVSPQNYFGQLGGLYGNYINAPPPSHAQKIQDAASQIVPLDASGSPDPNGKVVFITAGMSNALGKSNAFITQANASGSGKSPKVQIINTARGSVVAERWATNYQGHWDNYVIPVITNAGATPEQVQVVWHLNTNFASPDGLNSIDTCENCLRPDAPIPGGHVSELTGHFRTIMKEFKNRFPNVKLVFMSNRSYGGYAVVELNDEPYAYENAFAVRNVILEQVNNTDQSSSDFELNYSNSPVLTWGPYLWADDNNPNSQGLSWLQSDYTTTDGTHPSAQGYTKAGAVLLNFFLNNQYSGWFTNP